MAVIIKDLGVVTAYAYAVAGGYVGTEAEFTELLGNIAEDLETIENLTVSATTLPAGSEATASYSNGHLTLGIPQGIKGDKGDKGDKGNTGATGNGIASIALTSTSGAVKTYTITFTDGTTTTFDVTDGEVTTESLLETLEEYAKIDGLYEDMTVGNAEQLIASDYVTDKAPYLFRKTGGSTDVGNREYDTLVGASAVWNQLVGSSDTSVTVQSGHKYLSKISGTFALGSSGGTAITVDGANGDMVVDLTKFFGSATIPDYVYTLEQSTTGSGVAWLRQYYPKLFEYHEYDAGTLKSVEGVSSHDMVGFNAWDEEWESGAFDAITGEPIPNAAWSRSINFIPVLGRNIYYLLVDGINGIDNYVYITMYDASKNYIDKSYHAYSEIFNLPDNCYYIKIQYKRTIDTVINYKVCINLSNSGYRNGEYEPYWKRSYPLDSTWVGRGIYKLGSDGKPYADGDTYASDGTVTVNYTERAYQSGDESLADAITDGTNTVVKLTTPTTTTLTPFQSPQICDDFGTEEYVTDCLIPVGHETKYPANLRDKVQHLPDLSNLGNGNYVINQTGTQMSLIPTTSIIPAVPTEDGTYTLKCTVASGQATLTWEVDS